MVLLYSRYVVTVLAVQRLVYAVPLEYGSFQNYRGFSSIKYLFTLYVLYQL